MLLQSRKNQNHLNLLNVKTRTCLKDNEFTSIILKHMKNSFFIPFVLFKIKSLNYN